ncbi:MAG: ATPase [Culturomica sp.]|nr:ATPase [Culturomica sp.]
MKKLSLLIFHEDYRHFLEELREKGVVHIHENRERSAADDRLQAQLATVKRQNELILRLQQQGQAGKRQEIEGVKEEDVEEHLRKKYHRLEQLVQQIASVQKELALYEPWGTFSAERIDALERAGWKLRFYSVPEQKFRPEWEEAEEIAEIGNCKGYRYFVHVGKEDPEPDLEADACRFPAKSQQELAGLETALRNEYDELKTWLDAVSADAVERLKQYREKVLEVVDERQVQNAVSVAIEGRVIALEGWFPADREAELLHFLENRELYYEIARSTPEDEVPVKLKNNRFSRLFEPIGAMYDLPNYGELDLTPFFAPFFMLFFGLCMGDGGYGLLIWAVCFLLRKRMAPGLCPYLKLGEYLGAATTVVGLVTGSFLGISLDAVTWPWLQGVKHYFLTQDNYGAHLGGYNPMLLFAFAIGGVQILCGMCLKVAKIAQQHGWKYALSDLGWTVLLVLLAVVFGLPALGVTLPQPLVWGFYGIMGLCALAIFFYNSPGKNIFLNLGAGIWGAYNMATGLLGDLLSYVRLFALGLTGSILGNVFNMLAIDMTASLPMVPKFLLMFFILIAGHSLNFVIAMIGALVHPMRLTFVEFYKSAGFEGMGKKYDPFRKRVR